MNLLGGVISIQGITYLMFVVFAITALGLALGRIRIKGIDLGTAGVFIVALIFGCLFYPSLEAQFGTYTKNALKIIENIGLILFVTSVGFIAGPKFFGNLKRNFKSYVLLGFFIIASGWIVAILCILIGRVMGEPDPERLTAIVAGLFSGALTSTPAFSAAKSTVAAQYEDLVSVGYGIAYIYGVIGVVLFVQLIPKLTHASIPDELRRLEEVSGGSGRSVDKSRLIEMDPYGMMPFGLAAIVGILIGMIRIPLSAKGFDGTTFSLTTTGGCLLSALIFGHFGHIGRVSMMPNDKSCKTFREFGLVLFLLGAGVSGGAQFVQNFKVIYFIYGFLITNLSMIIGYFFATRVLKLNLLNALSAITGGMTSTPALGTLISVAGSEEVASAYAATYPVALIAVVLATQFLIILF